MRIYFYLLDKIVLPIGDILLGTRFIKHLRSWRKLQYASEADLHQLQQENLNKILKFTTTNIRYYKNISLTGNAEHDLRNFPILYKHMMKDDIDAFVYGDKNKLICEKSSGSSGVQGTVYMSKQESSQSIAVQTLWWEWAGYRFGDSIFQRGMTTTRSLVKSVKDWLLNTTYVSAFKLDEDDAKKYIHQFSQKPVKHMGGYASSLYVFAKLAEEMKEDRIHFKSVISWGDKMFPHYRSVIEKQFHTKVYDTYGCTEGLMIAGQCEHGNMHVMTPHIYIELLDDNGNEVNAGEIGKVVVTRLDNFSMPLIRYYLGDLAIAAPRDKKCACGRHFPILEKIIGRDTDIVKTPKGKFLIVHFFTIIMEHTPEVKQFRVIQENIDGIEFEYIIDKGFSHEVLTHIETKIRETVTEPFTIKFTQVTEIPNTASGKPQMIKSLLK
jgi:phenylacetate-CoA ligase